jgi:antitoxin ParD1/3/4
MNVAEKISVTMTPDMLRDIRDSVSAGEYASTSEALRDAVRLWRQRRHVADIEPSVVVAESVAKIRRARIDAIIARYQKRPLLDSRSADEIIGYNEFGVPE